MSKRNKRQRFTDTNHLPPINAQTEKQSEFLKSLRTNDTTIVSGPAGTGKTYIATAWGATNYYKGLVDRIIVTRPAVSSGKSLGFLPGDFEEKIEPWVMPVADVLKEYLSKTRYEADRKTGKIEIASFEHMRGRTFNNAFVLLDEAQNTTVKEMEMFLTRLGTNSIVVIDGDLRQSDIRGQQNGLYAALDIYKNSKPQDREGMAHIEFSVDDVVRSDRCAWWIRKFYERLDNKN